MDNQRTKSIEQDIIKISWFQESPTFINPYFTGCIEYPNGDRSWYLNGGYHREDGPAIEFESGSCEWYIHGLLHRDDGPAIELSNGSKFWYNQGKLHRVDGPAIEWNDGNKEWYLNGMDYSQEEWFEQLSDEDKLKAIWNLR
jgi:hypothetical protein